MHVDTYYYNRTRDAIVNYIKTKMSGDLYTLKKTEEAERLLTAESTIALGFLDSLKVHTHIMAGKVKSLRQHQSCILMLYSFKLLELMLQRCF